MKAKNQQHFTSEIDAKEKLIVYVYEYLIHSGAKQAAETFKENIGYNKEIKVNEGPGFLLDWWCVFWDLYCAAPERRHTQPESSNDARAFHDFMRTPMSPSIAQPSPPPQFMTGPAYRGPPPPGQARPGLPPRMQGPLQHGPLPPGGFMPATSPRYTQHGGPLPQPHMNQGVPMGFGHPPGPEHQMGPSPGLNRMTPVGGQPHSIPPQQQQQQVVGPPLSNGPPPQQMVGIPPGQQMGGPPTGQVNPLQQGPLRNGSQGNAGGWQGGVNYGNVNSPACYSSGPGSNQPGPGGSMMMSDGSMMEVKNSPGLNGGEASTPHAEEYVMPVPFGQDPNDQCDTAEIFKIKQSMQEDTTKMFEKEQSEFNLGDYSDPQNKWS